MKKIIFPIFLFFTSTTFINAQTEFWQKELLTLVNELRTKGCKCGNKTFQPVKTLAWSEKLSLAAYNHAADMQANRYFNHRSRDGQDYGDRIDAVGYRWQFCGENIAQGQRSAKEVFTDWKNSPSHCKNMMGKDFKEMGAAKVVDYWAQEFGTLLAPNMRIK